MTVGFEKRVICLADENKIQGDKDIAEFFREFDKISEGLNRGPAAPAQARKGQPSGRSVSFSGSGPADGAQDPASALAAASRAASGERVAYSPRAAAGESAGAGDGAGRDGRGGRGGGGRKKGKKKRRFHPIRLLLSLLVLAAVACGISGCVYVNSIISDTPEIDPNDISSLLTQNSTLYDSAGNVIDDIYMGDGMRTSVLYSDLPQDLIDAIVSVEDKTFWTHHGFNVVRIVGAIRDSVVGGGQISGTSTITQQLARNLWLPEDMSKRTLRRKIQEAYYSLQIENRLTKEQILEAYMNTIPFGNRAFGAQAASQFYFSKDVQDLSLLECAAIASLPKAPSRYAMVQTVQREDVSLDDPNLLALGDQYAYVYSDAIEGRKNMILGLMLEQGYIEQAEYDASMAASLRDCLKPRFDSENVKANYFTDFVIGRVTEDLMTEFDLSEDEALQMAYNGGLKIYTTMDPRIQALIEAEFSDNANFPKVQGKKDRAGNILDANGNILLYSYENIFDVDGNFALLPEEYEPQPNGDLVLFAKKRLNFYSTTVNGVSDYSVEFKDLYIQDEDKTNYIVRGGVIMIPAEYKSKNESGDLVIKGEFFLKNPGIFNFSDVGAMVGPSGYSLKQQVVQPQAAMVVIDHKTGEIKAMVGGRNTKGRLLYNRAASPRQPGSSIKPIGVYAPALQMGARMEPITEGDLSYGNYWTAASGVLDAEMSYNGNVWPKNWYGGYRGLMSVRTSIEQSVNVNAVKVQMNIGAERSASFLKSLGVSTLVETGTTNDMNPAALALGGMTHGISPLEMAAAYGAFPNEGLYVEPRPYTRITNRVDEIIISREPYTNQAMDPGVAFIMTDMLRGTVTNGIAGRASIAAQPVGGKTGTTSEKYDAWFVGFTPQYSASLWIGCDVSVEMSEGSGAAARVWSKIMQQVCEGTERGSFPGAPSNVHSMTVDRSSGLLPGAYSATRSEYFVIGTEPTTVDIASAPAHICPVSGFLATPYCPARIPFDTGDPENPIPKPEYYCHLHNGDPEAFPIGPGQELSTSFYWDGVMRDEDYYNGLEQDRAGDAGAAAVTQPGITTQPAVQGPGGTPQGSDGSSAGIPPPTPPDSGADGGDPAAPVENGIPDWLNFDD
ncbi:MAG: transglycosylase domain-containing protein [Clostridiales Family XIII bacterium]|jgi:penicillin-binding protein 1A|nr:transglycosylase domain-containing protein [Clostridiales Family XIII bacterium]